MADKTLINKPIITEKASQLAAFHQYVFEVADGATAPEIKKAIELVYKVKVAAVRVINVKSKERRIGRSIGTKPGYRKAIVTLKSGEKLDLLTA